MIVTAYNVAVGYFFTVIQELITIESHAIMAVLSARLGVTVVSGRG